jgi:hypothetical protein
MSGLLPLSRTLRCGAGEYDMTTLRLTCLLRAAVLLAVAALAAPALAEDPPAAPAAAATPATPQTPAAAPAMPAPAAPTAAAPDASPAAAAPAAPAAPAAAPPANTGRVYVSYPVQPQASYDANLAIDDLWIADAIKSGSCVYFDVPVGDHKLHATTTQVWHVSVAAGDSKYADLKFRGGTTNGLVPVDGAAPANLAACTQGTSPL